MRDDESIEGVEFVLVALIERIAQPTVEAAPGMLIDYIHICGGLAQNPRVGRDAPARDIMTERPENYGDIADNSDVEVKIEEAHGSPSIGRLRPE